MLTSLAHLFPLVGIFIALTGTGMYHYLAHGRKHEVESKKDDEQKSTDGTLSLSLCWRWSCVTLLMADEPFQTDSWSAVTVDRPSINNERGPQEELLDDNRKGRA